MIEIALIGIVLYAIFGRAEVFFIVMAFFFIPVLRGKYLSNKCPACKGSGYSGCEPHIDRCITCNGIGRVLKKNR